MRDTVAFEKSLRRSALEHRQVSPARRDARSQFVEYIRFFRAFVRRPQSVGALAPSSRSLALAMIQGLELTSADTVVELGPGTGAITEPIVQRLGPGTTFIALELDASHARGLQRRFPKLPVYNDSAERVRHYLGAHHKEKANCIISGLPWASLDREVQTRIMDEIMESLAENGVFTTFAYLHARWLPKARRYRNKLEKLFARVEMSPVVWKNLPPAFVYRCYSPRSV